MSEDKLKYSEIEYVEGLCEKRVILIRKSLTRTNVCL